MSDVLIDVLAFIGAVVVGLVLFFAIEWCLKSGPRFYRQWSPWRLRSALSVLKGCLADDRGLGGDGQATQTEQNYRYARAALAGHPDPASYAEAVYVRNGALVIKSTTPKEAS